MIKPDEMKIIQVLLKAAYNIDLSKPTLFSIWYESFKNYSIDVIETATRKYIATNRFKPNPADIIQMLPAPEPTEDGFKPDKWQMVNGKWTKVVNCRRCNDLGLIVYEDAEQRKVGRICTCDAALHYYGRRGDG